MRSPTNGKVTLGFGSTLPPYSQSDPHMGADYSANLGDNVYAPHAGKITIAGKLGDCGLAVQIGTEQNGSRLCHNSKILVKVGQSVEEGQVIARAGDTGKAFGVHVHWVLFRKGKRVDPEKYVEQNEDMYKGKTAKQWHDIAVRRTQQAKRFQSQRNAFKKVIETIKKLVRK